jgi:hypothetical protein
MMIWLLKDARVREPYSHHAALGIEYEILEDEGWEKNRDPSLRFGISERPVANC